MKVKRGLMIIGLVGLTALTGCDDPPRGEGEPTALPLNETIVETAEGVLETEVKAQSFLCEVCLLGGVSSDCTGVCR